MRVSPSVPDPRAVVVCDLGRAPYEPTWALQRRLQARLIAAKRAEPPEAIPHVLLLVEHPPVYTLGKNGDAAHLLLPEDDLARRGATFVHIDRGGDITYHGPGQLVGYPILDLDRFFTDIGRYLRALEQVMIDTCADYGLEGRRSEAGTGVWIGPDDRGDERKICALGIRCSRWVTMHGFAFNVAPDLSYFGHIIPCGIQNKGVTSLAAELGRPVDPDEARRRVVGHFARTFEASIVETLSGDAARDFLESYAEEAVTSA